MANVIFDFDGTLADTFPLIVDVSYNLSPGTRRLPERELDKLRQLPLLTAMRRLGLPKWYIPFQMLFIRRKLTSRMHEVPPYDGIVPVLRKLHNSGHKLFVLTSNYKENAGIFLKNNGLKEIFTDMDSVLFANMFLKTRALKKMIRRHDLVYSECYYVGNEGLDVKTAERAGIHGVAATWGGFDRSALKRAKPDAIIDKPQELAGLLQ